MCAVVIRTCNSDIEFDMMFAQKYLLSRKMQCILLLLNKTRNIDDGTFKNQDVSRR